MQGRKNSETSSRKRPPKSPLIPEAIECGFFDPNPGDRVRIAIVYDGTLRPILWLEVAGDGSVYLGPRHRPVNELRHGRAERLESGEYFIEYAGGERITKPEILKRAKFSFHASGAIHAPNARVVGSSIRSLRGQRLLCSLLFKHPRAYKPIQEGAIRKRDVCLAYPIVEDHPLWGDLFVAPRDAFKVARRRGAVFQVNSIFDYADLEGVPDLRLQLVLSHGARGPWPPFSFLWFVGKKSELEVGPGT